MPRATTPGSFPRDAITIPARGEGFDVRSRRRHKADHPLKKTDDHKKSQLFYDSDSSIGSSSSHSPLCSPRSKFKVIKKRRISTNPEQKRDSKLVYRQPITSTLPSPTKPKPIRTVTDSHLMSPQLTQQTLLSQTQCTQLSLQHSTDILSPTSGPYINPPLKRTTLSPSQRSGSTSTRYKIRRQSSSFSFRSTADQTECGNDSQLLSSSIADIGGIPGNPMRENRENIYGPECNRNHNDLAPDSHHNDEQEQRQNPQTMKTLQSHQTVSGRKRKRSMDYFSDFDDIDRYNKHNRLNQMQITCNQSAVNPLPTTPLSISNPVHSHSMNPRFNLDEDHNDNDDINNINIRSQSGDQLHSNPDYIMNEFNDSTHSPSTPYPQNQYQSQHQNEYQNEYQYQYQPPSPRTAQRQQLLPPSPTHSQFKKFQSGDTVYMFFQEYYQKYNDTRPMIEAMHRVSSTHDDLLRLEALAETTGYLDAEIIGFYQCSNTMKDAMSKMIGEELMDYNVLRNWRILVIQHRDQQLIVHDICDHHGRSRLREYMMSEKEFIDSIQDGPRRGDFVKIKGAEHEKSGYGRIMEISPFEPEKYLYSPYKSLSVMSLTTDQKMDIFADGQKYFRSNPWDVVVIGRPSGDTVHGMESMNSNNVGVDKYGMESMDGMGKQEMVQFVRKELISFFPVQPTHFSPHFKQFEDLMEDERTLFDPQWSVDDLERMLNEIRREMVYTYTCLEGEDRRKYNDQFIGIMERIISLSHPNVQQMMVQSVSELMEKGYRGMQSMDETVMTAIM